MKKKNKVWVKFCPKCRSTELFMVGGGILGLHKCKKCGFIGSILPEIEIKDGEKLKRK